MTVTVTIKGQVTIPKPVRDLLGIAPGSAVDFRRNDRGEIVLVPAESDTTSRFDRFRGHAGEGLDTNAIMALLRSEN